VNTYTHTLVHLRSVNLLGVWVNYSDNGFCLV